MAKRKRTQVKVLLVYLSTLLVCILIFGTAALFLMDVFVTQPAQEREQEELAALEGEDEPEVATDYSALRKTYLFVGAENQTLNGMALIRVLPDSGNIFIVPVSKLTLATVGNISGTMSALFESGGMDYLISAVESTFGISCDSYIKITNEGWKSLVEYFGGVTSYTFPEELYYKNEDTGELTSFSQGLASRTLWGDDLRRIITYPLYTNGEQTTVSVIGELSVSLINSAFTTHAEDVKNNLQSIFNTIFNNSDTNITTPSFNEMRPAYEYMLDNFTTPASYRLAKGTWDERGYFTVAEDFKTELAEYFELEEAAQ